MSVLSKPNSCEKIDYADSWEVTKISDRAEFIKFIVSNAPGGVLWRFTDVMDRKNLIEIAPYCHLHKIIPLASRHWIFDLLSRRKQCEMENEILISPAKKEEIIELISKLDFSFDFIHNFVYSKERNFLVSYDYFSPVWISKYFSLDILNAASVKLGFQFEDSGES
jgi:hypothetical protein